MPQASGYGGKHPHPETAKKGGDRRELSPGDMHQEKFTRHRLRGGSPRARGHNVWKGAPANTK